MNCKLFTLLLLLTCFILTSCDDGAPAEIKALQSEAMRIHDEVMPKMSNINKTRRKLKKMVMDNPENSNELFKAIKDLEIADDAMMDWMAAYKKYDQLEPNVDPASYYKNEINRITVVQDLMLSALSNGKKLLKNE